MRPRTFMENLTVGCFFDLSSRVWAQRKNFPICKKDICFGMCLGSDPGIPGKLKAAAWSIWIVLWTFPDSWKRDGSFRRRLFKYPMLGMLWVLRTRRGARTCVHTLGGKDRPKGSATANDCIPLQGAEDTDNVAKWEYADRLLGCLQTPGISLVSERQ